MIGAQRVNYYNGRTDKVATVVLYGRKVEMPPPPNPRKYEWCCDVNRGPRQMELLFLLCKIWSVYCRP